ncbi:MAG: chromate transporter [Clostridia bacterium]|nr:chromate transporter [Clostridia bacterium]
MTILRLCAEFFMTGLFAVGGGLATLPFLYEIGEKTGWYTDTDVLDMLAISESTPGPIGVNMATYVGYNVSGVLGGIMATLALVLPSVIISVIISGFLERFKGNSLVNGTFRILRPASTALITAAGLGVAWKVFFPSGLGTGSVWNMLFAVIDYKSLILAAAVALTMVFWKKVNPILLIVASAVIGVVFSL